jgi:hypothetical protein
MTLLFHMAVPSPTALPLHLLFDCCKKHDYYLPMFGFKLLKHELLPRIIVALYNIYTCSTQINLFSLN